MAHTEESKLPSDIGPPISFGFVKTERTISRRKYSFSIQDSKECFRDETNDKCIFEDDVSGFLPPLTPKLTKAGKVAVHQPYVPRQPLNWWKVQCAFRGLPQGGTVSALQQRIRAHGANGLGCGMEASRNAMRIEYETEVERRWKGMNADEKVVAWPRRFLYETFLKHRSSKKVVHVVDVKDWGEGIEAACRAMKVCCQLRKMPHHQTGQRTVVLGMDGQAVSSKYAELNQNAEKVILEQRKAQEQEKKEKSSAFERKFLQAVGIQKSDKGNWDVPGKWIIDCPYVQEQWGSTKSTCELEINITTPNDAGMDQIWATFDFIILTGSFRFVNPEAETETISFTKSTPGAMGTVKDDSHDEGADDEGTDDEGTDDEGTDDEGTDDEGTDNEGTDDEGTSPSQFLFSRSAIPSSGSKKFQFRWRGEETGMGEIQLYSDKKLCHLTFESKDALSGVFKSDLTGTIKFRGVRKGCNSDKTLNLGQKRKHELIYEGDPPSAWRSRSEAVYDPASEWRSRSEAAYESARVGRWR